MCTKIDSLAKTRGNVKPKTTPLLAKLVYGSEDLDHVPAIKWGKENEDKALSDFHAIAIADPFKVHLNPKNVFRLINSMYVQ